MSDDNFRPTHRLPDWLGGGECRIINPTPSGYGLPGTLVWTEASEGTFAISEDQLIQILRIPTEPGLYSDRNGGIWRLNEKPPARPHGNWHGPNGLRCPDSEMTDKLPLTRLVSEPDVEWLAEWLHGRYAPDWVAAADVSRRIAEGLIAELREQTP